jgi:membrane protein insertase Oxa1/YidC/SpoIIIJ
MKRNHDIPPVRERKPLNRSALRRLILLVVNTLLFFTVYRVLIYYGDMTQKTFGSFVVMVTYMALLLGFVLAYLIYNRFLYRKGITREQLPDDWSEEEKTAFIEDGERRLKRSSWMMLIIFPLIFTFLMDAIDLFIIDEVFRK